MIKSKARAHERLKIGFRQEVQKRKGGNGPKKGVQIRSQSREENKPKVRPVILKVEKSAENRAKLPEPRLRRGCAAVPNFQNHDLAKDVQRC